MHDDSGSAGGIFASRDFRRFYLGQASSYVGDGLRAISLPLLVFALTGSALNLGITFALEYFPFGIFSLVGGSLADRLPRKPVMIACDAIRCTIVAAFALAYRYGSLSLSFIYTGIVLHSICSAIFNGGQSSSIPYLLGKDRATRAVATLTGTEHAVNTVAPPLGGALFGLVGPFPALLINACTYLASLFSLGTLRDLGPETTGGMPGLREIGLDVAIGFRFLFADPAMRTLSIGSFLGTMLGTVGFVGLVPFIKGTIGGNDASVGIAFGAVGLGAATGAAIAARLKMPFGKQMTFVYAFGGLPRLPMLWTHSMAVVWAALGISAIGAGCAIASTIGWRMRVIPEETVGRVFGAVRLLVLFGTLPGALAGGAIADAFGPWSAQAIAIFGNLAVAAWILSHRTVREDRR